MKLKEVLRKKIEEHRPRTTRLVKEFGGTKVQEITIDQVIGGARDVKCLVTDISYLDPQEGIRFRGKNIPDDPLFYEKFYFTPGDLGFRAWQTRYARIGVLICWDQWYPEAARLTALQGAEILFYPTAIGWHPSEKAEYGSRQHNAWETIQRAHAVANGCYVAVANRVGHEKLCGDGIEFWGQSFVAGTSGEILARTSTDREENLVVPIDLDKVDTTRTHWPFLRDRRIDAYGDLTRRLID
jgi:N-carbamoylputrescine amidase